MYQAYFDDAAGYPGGYGYGPGETVPFLDPGDQLAGPGTSAYVSSDQPAGYVRTGYAYEDYYGGTSQRDTTASSNNYAVQTESSYYANGNAYTFDTYNSLHDGSFGYYSNYSGASYEHGTIDYIATSSSSLDVFDGSAFHAYDYHSQQTFYANGSYTTDLETSSTADYNGSYVAGSHEQHVQQSYTNAYGYTTVYQNT